MIVFCDDHECIYNQDGSCKNECISIGMKFGEFRSGNRICYHACQDFEGRDGND